MSGRFNKQMLFKPFAGLTSAFALAAIIYAAMTLNTARLDTPFLILALITVLFSSRMTLIIPRVKGFISVSDTFIFLTMLLYGGSAAILISAAEAFCSSIRFSRKPLTIIFNSAALACSTFITTRVLRFYIGETLSLENAAQTLTVVCLIALTQYAFNSWIVATGVALKTGQSIFGTWRRGYLWTSITYFAGASAAGVIARLLGSFGLYALLAMAPVVAIIYFTYRTYLKNIETIAAQAEMAERHVEELNHYIAEQERIREQFSQLEKLSALGELASGVAHDFNNTLAGILARAQLLQRTNDVEKIRRGLQVIIQSAEDGAKTVKRIQDFARQRRDHDLELVAVDQLLHDVAEITRPRWKDQAEANSLLINFDVQASSNAFVMGDASELREVLVNMVFNSVDAMPHGGRLTLRSEPHDDHVLICINDSGTGMTEEVRSRIFDPFFTTKGKAGMGLGLAVSFGIIRRHEGSIEVESTVGAGSNFRISLPAAKVSALPDSKTADEVMVIKPQQQTLPAKFLVVDDEKCVREVLCDILQGEGYVVRTAASGREGLDIFHAEKFDAVFTDIGMPGMSGWELARAIRATQSAVPIAVITGWGEAVGSQEQREANVNWIVTKPFSVSRIAELANEVTATRENNRAEFACCVAA